MIHRLRPRHLHRTALTAIALCALFMLVAPGLTSVPAHASPGPGESTKSEAGDERQTSSSLSLADAVILGIVEGVTEYLPVSSTGHLLVTQRLLGMTGDAELTEAADSYAIAIQSGAILAVVLLYRRRLLSIIKGIVGRDPHGRRMAVALVASFAPAVVIALLGEQYIKGYLFDLWPIAAAWLVGGVVILLVARHDLSTGLSPEDGADIEDLTLAKAFGIGLLQCVAMWPGVSRSLVTILGGRLMGLSTIAAVEYSFLLGLVTLTAATAYEAATQGGEIVATFGLVTPLVGVVAAFIAAALAIEWMISYLHRHSLSIFGWYRLGVGALLVVLLLLGVL